MRRATGSAEDDLGRSSGMKHLRRAGSLGMGLLAVGLAGGGEAVIRSGNFSGLGGALYLLGIALFSIGAWPLPSGFREAGAVFPGVPRADRSPESSRSSTERSRDGAAWSGRAL